VAAKAKSEPIQCIRCARISKEGDRFCANCGAPLQNRCFDEPGPLKKGCRFVNEPTAAYCAKCGEPTLFHIHGLIQPAYPPGANKPAMFGMNWPGFGHRKES
jgi:hypothetical protein